MSKHCISADQSNEVLLKSSSYDVAPPWNIKVLSGIRRSHSCYYQLSSVSNLHTGFHMRTLSFQFEQYLCCSVHNAYSILISVRDATFQVPGTHPVYLPLIPWDPGVPSKMLFFSALAKSPGTKECYSICIKITRKEKNHHCPQLYALIVMSRTSVQKFIFCLFLLSFHNHMFNFHKITQPFFSNWPSVWLAACQRQF